MKKTYNEVLALSNTLNAVSRNKIPFSVGLAKNLKHVETILNDYNVKREEVVDKFVKRDAEGNILGVEREVKDKAGNVLFVEGTETPQMERVQKPQRIDETEWNDREAFEKELIALNATTVELDLKPIDVKKKYLDLNTGKDLAIEDYLDTNFEPSLLIFLSNYGFFSGLDI